MSSAAGQPDMLMSERLMRRAGIDAGQFKALLYALALMDFRNQQYAGVSRSKPTEVFTPLFWTMGQNLITSGILCTVLFARVDTYFFVFASMSTSMLVMIASLIVEYDEAVLNPHDLEVIGHLPVPVRTYSAARLINLLGYVLLVTISMNVFPAIMGLGHAETGWLYFPSYVAAALSGNLLIAGAVVLVYSWVLGGRPAEGARQLLAWTQVVLILVFFYGGQAVFRDSGNQLEMAAYHMPAWVVNTPPGWLARFVESATAGEASVWWLVGVTSLGALVVWLAAGWRLSIAYAQMQPGTGAWQRTTMPPLSHPGQLGSMLVRLLTRPGAGRIGFWFCWTTLGRDSGLRMRVWPSLGTVIALPCLGLATGHPRWGGRDAAGLSLSSGVAPADGDLFSPVQSRPRCDLDSGLCASRRLGSVCRRFAPGREYSRDVAGPAGFGRVVCPEVGESCPGCVERAYRLACDRGGGIRVTPCRVPKASLFVARNKWRFVWPHCPGLGRSDAFRHVADSDSLCSRAVVAVAYWQKQITWIRTGRDPEYALSAWVPAHVQLLAGVVIFSFTSWGVIPFAQGFYEVDLMNYYNAKLAATSLNEPLAIATGWHIWSALRGVGYLFITFEVISLSLELVSGRKISTTGRRRMRWALGLGFLLADGLIKANILEATRLQLLSNLK